ncbi:putative methyltransferase C9orf114 [Vitis vinifera]|uniref:Putative methyltransferase C9orf114 n=1 Tax=Vitis vinifera TaxID=29760 RepID=A0A438KLM7_VITVI|nr:putative methyltransferase C9orf114 [Vitis vinifera]
MGKKKKRRSDFEAETENNTAENETELINGDSRSKKKKNKTHKDKYQATDIPTLTIAVPGSIIHNAQSLELATRLAGQVARAATIFRIDEVVVFDCKSTSGDNSTVATPDASDENETGAAFLIRILRYLETPQYLRKILFPKHNSLKFVGMLPPLDAPHHLRKHEWGPYREGVTLKERAPSSVGTLVDVGLNKNVVIDQVLEPGIRVTVAMGTNRNLDADIIIESEQIRFKFVVELLLVYVQFYICCLNGRFCKMYVSALGRLSWLGDQVSVEGHMCKEIMVKSEEIEFSKVMESCCGLMGRSILLMASLVSWPTSASLIAQGADQVHFLDLMVLHAGLDGEKYRFGMFLGFGSCGVKRARWGAVQYSGGLGCWFCLGGWSLLFSLFLLALDVYFMYFVHQVVSSSKPREEVGTYWGYKVRYASNISSVFKECPFKGGYDHLIGTSEHGLIVKSSELDIPSFRELGRVSREIVWGNIWHLLIAFGGLAGLEESVEEDHSLKGKNVREIFDSYLNTCPNQGSRTIRTEEAILISLQYFQEPINRALQRFEYQSQGSS